MTHNSKENLLLKLILCIMLVIGGKELWAFDRHAKPTFVATWTLDKTAPEYNALPKGNPTLSYRPHKVSDTSQLRFYENTCKVALYSPGTNQFFVIKAENVQKAYELWQDIAIRYTYYKAEDRTFDLFPNTKNGKIDYEDRKYANVEEIRSGELFLNYLYRAEGNLGNGGYGTGEVNNKYIQDQLTVIFNYDAFKQYVQNYNANDVKSLIKFGNPYRHKYLDNMDLRGMKKRIAEIYSPQTVWNNWIFSFGGSE